MPVDQSGGTRKRVDLERRLLSRNHEQAQANRDWLAQRGVVALDLVSAPGTGKTTLLARTLEELRRRDLGCAVIVGDVQTDNDARRLQGKGAPVHQIQTGGSCHLSAAAVGELLPEVVQERTRLLFIENVGNLVCPAAFDLGENMKVALLSVTEGEDKPQKYPALFSRARATVVTKLDLLPHLEFDLQRCRDYLLGVQPGARVFELSAHTGAGLDAWCDWLGGLVK